MVGADNQQERLSITEAEKWFLGGIVEGEGSYCVSIKNQPRARFGFVVDPEFFIYQHEHGKSLLEMARRVFGTGRIVRKVGNEKVLAFHISARKSLSERVIPFLFRYVHPFSAKREIIERFAEIVEAFGRKEHMDPRGLVRIVEKAYAMNPGSRGKERKRSLEEVKERILRGHTLDLPLIREVKIWSSPHGDVEVNCLR